MRKATAFTGSIGKKIARAIAASVLIVAFIGILMAYLVGLKILKDNAGREYSQIAKTLGAHTLMLLADEIEDAKSYATRPLWRDVIKEVNLKYSSMGKKDIEEYMSGMDVKWAAAEKDSLFLIEYLRNRISLSIQDITQVRKAVSGIFITDKYGGLVAASDKTGDFYQANEEWWQKAYNGGKGAVYISDIEFDDASGYWAVSIAVPVFENNKEAIGVLKYSISVEKLFQGFTDVELGDTGRAVLVDSSGRIIVNHDVIKTREHKPARELIKALESSHKPYMTILDKNLDDKKIFTAYAKADLPELSDMGIHWWVLIIQEDSEVSRYLDKFILWVFAIGILMVILTIPLGSIFGAPIARPIHELQIATEHVMAGDLDYAVKVKTNDEVGQLAEVFSQMILSIKNKQREIESFSHGLETKVQERTKELDTAQEATLNILEDLQAAKEDLERTNKELLKLDQLKSDFISTVSHELRTPLSIIKEGISLVLDKIPGGLNEKQVKILDISKYNIDRLARIIDSLLDISKIEAGKVELKRGLIDISGIVKQIAASFEKAMKDKGLELRLNVDVVTGKVYADADRMVQVLTNLMSNAVKFTPSGHIDISCKDQGDAVTCSVADTGVGISKDDLHKVFDKFQQFGRTAGAGDKGTGLGLSIAKNIIDMHNGAIWVESEAGKGTKFTFKLHKYTPQSLFGEYIAKAISKAAHEDARMSVIAVKSEVVVKGDTSPGLPSRKFHDIMHEAGLLIKNTLRREGDGVVNNAGEMIVILADCDKESAARVQYRLEEMVNKYLSSQEVSGMIKMNYGYATYPDDAMNDMELIDKAKAALAVSAKA